MPNRNMLKTQTTSRLPALQSSFMGAYPPTKTHATSYNGGIINYFQKYRNEVLSRFSMPSYDWGSSRKVTYVPRPELVSAIGVHKYEKSLAIPINNITTIDAGRMREVDELYKGVQMHRQQYKDHTRKLHPLDFFRSNEYSYQCAPSLLPSYLFKYPQTYIEYKLPSVLPLTYEKRMNTPFIPDLAFPGIYNSGSCIAYKR
ncbi:uncharacterized protein LOC107264965 [Cephus cinctus]|uniref:Uncharacterized protein LOC107264965 n=1 Tax=Cephus cinctus TaxID=211228 RepID=A0AAJ7BMG8_CEPCN|nr:uncharacterized protein LOC107264965 [Cephus cinctus]